MKHQKLQLATIEQSKKLKKLGLDWECDMYYTYEEMPVITSVPSIQLALKWFRDKKELHGYVDCNASGWFWNIFKTNGTFINSGYDEGPNEGGVWNIYEEAEKVLLDELINLSHENK